MSTISLSEVKAYLGSVHDEDDAAIQGLIDDSESRICAFLEVDSLAELSSSNNDNFQGALSGAVKLLVRAQYDENDPQAIKALDDLAFDRVYPFRNLGI